MRLLGNVANRRKAKVREGFEEFEELRQPFARGLRVGLAAHGVTVRSPGLADKGLGLAARGKGAAYPSDFVHFRKLQIPVSNLKDSLPSFKSCSEN
jgi:hypothetical protein